MAGATSNAAGETAVKGILTGEQRVARLEAVRQIKNLMARLAHRHAVNEQAHILELYALQTPGVRAEMPLGVYEGREGLERLYLRMTSLGGDHRGRLHMHTLTTPLIEVAGDLQSAKGIWLCPGHATDRNPADAGAPLEAAWVWTKYGCDFVIEQGQWKIWHLRVHGIFRGRYDQSFADGDIRRGGPPGPPPGAPRPDRPPSGWWQYSPDSVYPNEPAPPEPYQAFDGATAY
jgi:hypothetical protein